MNVIGKLLLMVVLAGLFLFGLTSVVYMSLQGKEIKVPTITGKQLSDSETELAQLGLKIKKRADRPDSEPANTVIDQSPKAGDVVKTGQVIYVVTSDGTGTADKLPTGITKDDEEDDSKKIEDMISDKPKKAKPTSTKKKAATTRDADPDAPADGAPDAGDTDTKGKTGDDAKPGDKPKGDKTPPAGGEKPKPVTSGSPAKAGQSESKPKAGQPKQ